MSTALRLSYLDEKDFERWDRFVDESDQGSIYSKSFYLEALTRAVGAQFKILAVWKGDELMGGVGLHFEDSRFGRQVRRRSLLYYNGLVLRRFDTKYPSQLTYKQMEIVRTLLQELEQEPYASVEMSNRSSLTDMRPFVWSDWFVWPQYTYEVPIADLDELWGCAEQNIRRLITRCEKSGMRVEASDDFDAFYRLHQSTYERKNLPPYLPIAPFRTLYEKLRERNNAELFLATTADGLPIAGQIVLFTGHPVTHTWAAGADAEHLDTGVSALLRWKAFAELSRRGYKTNDLTDAMDEKVAKFKSQFGGRLLPCYIVSRTNSRNLRTQNKLNEHILRPLSSLANRILPEGGRRPGGEQFD